MKKQIFFKIIIILCKPSIIRYDANVTRGNYCFKINLIRSLEKKYKKTYFSLMKNYFFSY